MLIRSIKLNNYRNYTNATFNFNPYLNIIIGKNGTGKTNLLESIVVTSNTKSFRTKLDQDLIKKNTDYTRIEVNTETNRYRVVINKNNKSLYIDNNLIKKTSDFIGKINAILFKPSDLELFTQSPNERRKLLDIEISKVSRRYITAILKYSHLLKDKNKLLKEDKIDEILLSVINEELEPLIQIIIEERQKFFQVINENISEMYSIISGKETKIEIKYKKCSEIAEIKNKIEESKEKDFYYHYTTYGTHHEDYDFIMNGYNINSVASQGQKRMVLIAFKFALIKYIENRTGQTPIVLLDDILSELDKDNQERLLNVIPQNTQIIITNTDIKNLNIKKDYKLIELKEEKDV